VRIELEEFIEATSGRSLVALMEVEDNDFSRGISRQYLGSWVIIVNFKFEDLTHRLCNLLKLWSNFREIFASMLGFLFSFFTTPLFDFFFEFSRFAFVSIEPRSNEDSSFCALV